MSWLISFAWTYSNCKERKPGITKLKILVHSGTRADDPWITKLLPQPLGYQILYTIDNLKPNQKTQQCVFILSCIQYCNYIIWVSFCCLTNIYWTNSKMTSIFITTIPNAWQNKNNLPYVAINTTRNTCGTLVSFKLSIVYQIWKINGCSSSLVIRRFWKCVLNMWQHSSDSWNATANRYITVRLVILT